MIIQIGGSKIKLSDFTKEELEEILEGVSWWLWLDGDNSIYYEELIKKIQFMIDNYCEHESDNMEPITFYCSKCGKEMS